MRMRELSCVQFRAKNEWKTGAPITTTASRSGHEQIDLDHGITAAKLRADNVTMVVSYRKTNNDGDNALKILRGKIA